MPLHTIKEEIKNEEGEVVSYAEYYFPTSKIDLETIEYTGEMPPLTEPQKEEILKAHKIHCGKVSRCSVCGHSLPETKTCAACENCGTSFGVCG